MAAFTGARLMAQMRIGYAIKVLNLPAHKISAWLSKTHNIFYAKRYMEMDIRRLAGRNYAAGRAKFLSPNAKPSRKIMGEIPTLRDAKYFYRFEFFAPDPVTGETKSQFLEMDSDRILTRREAEEAMADRYARGDLDDRKLTGTELMVAKFEFRLEAVFHHEGWGY